ncbi:MAG: hypothetical protein A3I11_00020 [Elusimicrobia bacterium RIFCSPLOWO2_02_FULL_39_32]|nr:MAG: hypothetical protein A3B80_04450 [Elusimicrobia bacterium RIFCSPHIGHO2_02_FULL_39_36]OGR93292.1 MAG: hypothetical protein A3I11_00020 [Elusimicrobia bacterium RIFCSPLOWO2_02_FULL_39_32]OGS00522.1 MAG: hypothetical protein A3G85_00420 [Elusimicrobia bacterium RIFCSPLOWO2_12_FULL_39_28]
MGQATLCVVVKHLNGEGFIVTAYFTKKEKPIHAVLGATGAVLIVITVYRPDEELWIDYRKRRK